MLFITRFHLVYIFCGCRIYLYWVLLSFGKSRLVFLSQYGLVLSGDKLGFQRFNRRIMFVIVKLTKFIHMATAHTSWESIYCLLIEQLKTFRGWMILSPFPFDKRVPFWRWGSLKTPYVVYS